MKTTDERELILREYRDEYKRTSGGNMYAEYVNGWVRVGNAHGIIGTYRMKEVTAMLATLKQRPTHDEQRKPAASPWRTDEPPKDGTRILGIWYGILTAARYEGGLWITEVYGERHCYHSDPHKWARINIPEGI